MWVRRGAPQGNQAGQRGHAQKLGGAGSGRRTVSIVYRYMRDSIEEIKAVKEARAGAEGYQHNEPIKKTNTKKQKVGPVAHGMASR